MKKGPIITVLVFGLLSAGLYFSPITPSGVNEEKTAEELQKEDLDNKVEEAVLMIQTAEGAPMAGIAKLKEVLEVDPNHVEANFWLGEFSLTTGQFQKAVPRFEKILEVQPYNADVVKRLATTFAQLQENEKAKNVLQKFIDENPKHESLEELKGILNNIK